MSILYCTKKYEKEVLHNQKMGGPDLYLKNLETEIDEYLYPEKQRWGGIDDAVSFYHMIGGTYALLSRDHYLAKDILGTVKYLYLFVLAMAKSFDHKRAGVKITNISIQNGFDRERNIEKAMFSAYLLGDPKLFEQYGDNLGCEIIKVMYNEDYEKADALVEQLPETAEIYANDRYWTAYCCQSKYLKAIYRALLDKDEKAFNKALTERIKILRRYYVLGFDIAALSIIKLARKLGIDYNFDVIEIPKELLGDLSAYPFDEWQLPNVEKQ